MKIVCPSCEATYEVPEVVMTARKKMRCARCGHDWVPADAVAPAAAEAAAAAPVPEDVAAPARIGPARIGPAPAAYQDAAADEAARPEAAAPEPVVPEAIVPEPVVPEAAVPEAVVPEAAVPEAGGHEPVVRAPGGHGPDLAHEADGDLALDDAAPLWPRQPREAPAQHVTLRPETPVTLTPRPASVFGTADKPLVVPPAE